MVISRGPFNSHGGSVNKGLKNNVSRFHVNHIVNRSGCCCLLPESFKVFRPIDKACFNRSASIGAEGADAEEMRDELIDLFASVIIKTPKKAKIMVME